MNAFWFSSVLIPFSLQLISNWCFDWIQLMQLCFKELLNCLISFKQHLRNQKNMCTQIFLIVVHISIMLKFWIFDPELQLIKTKPKIKNKSKDLLSQLKKFKVQAILVLHYKKRNDHKIIHWRVELIAGDSDKSKNK